MTNDHVYQHNISDIAFLVERAGTVIGNFKSVSGMDSEVSLQPVRLAKAGVAHQGQGAGGKTITLEGGKADCGALSLWCRTRAPMNITVSRLAPGGAVMRRWELLRARPVAWRGFTPDGRSQGAVAIETLEIAHEGLVFKR